MTLPPSLTEHRRHVSLPIIHALNMRQLLILTLAAPNDRHLLSLPSTSMSLPNARKALVRPVLLSNFTTRPRLTLILCRLLPIASPLAAP